MTFEGKGVWDLSVDEIEYIYRTRHMNNYVYAALKTYHTSAPPLGRPVSLRSEGVPACLHAPVGRLLMLSPGIGAQDPTFVRVAVAYCTSLVYSALDRVELRDVSTVCQLLAVCAYLPIWSGKNDNERLWGKYVVRPRTEYADAVMEKLLEPAVDVEEVCRMPMGARETPPPVEPGDLMNLFRFMPKVIRCIIGCMENGDDPQTIERALLHVEQAMVKYERDHGYSGAGYVGNAKYPGQIRYRNTIYLYGGMFFQRQGRYDRAVAWYLKDIDIPGLPMLLRGFLTDLKTVERLVCGYSVLAEEQRRRDLKERIHAALARTCQDAAAQGHRVLAYLKAHPETDMRITHSDNKTVPAWAGEYCREGYLLSLLYNAMVLGTDYRDIDYARFLRY